MMGSKEIPMRSLVLAATVCALIAAPSLAAAQDHGLEVRSVRTEHQGSRERVVIELSGPAEYRAVPSGEGPARLEIRGAHLAAGVPRDVPGTDGGSLRGLELRTVGNRVIVVADRADGTSATAMREGSRIV